MVSALHERLRAARLAQGLSQRQLALLAGCTQGPITRMETGRDTSWDMWSRLSKALGVSLTPDEIPSPARSRVGSLYCIAPEHDTAYVKVGFSANVKLRLCSLQTAYPSRIVVFGTMPGTTLDETRIHRKYASQRVNGEWFHNTAELRGEFDINA